MLPPICERHSPSYPFNLDDDLLSFKIKNIVEAYHLYQCPLRWLYFALPNVKGT